LEDAAVEVVGVARSLLPGQVEQVEAAELAERIMHGVSPSREMRHTRLLSEPPVSLVLGELTAGLVMAAVEVAAQGGLEATPRSLWVARRILRTVAVVETGEMAGISIPPVVEMVLPAVPVPAAVLLMDLACSVIPEVAHRQVLVSSVHPK
jgi:hypothetical protein